MTNNDHPSPRSASTWSEPQNARLSADTRRLRSDSEPTLERAVELMRGDAAFAERYTDLGVLGVGGMGEVRRYLDRKSNREIAIKRIDVRIDDPRLKNRFLREARIQAQLDHPTIVPVYDIGLDEHGREYFTMKRVSGVTLQSILFDLRFKADDTSENYSLSRLLAIFLKVCEGVEYAHSRGIIHRDLKPSNVIVGKLGETYVLDWGIAKIEGADDPDASRGLGTAGYMAPEQIADVGAADARSDIYALGAILFELLARAPFHDSRDAEEILSATQLGTSDPRVRTRRPELDIPPELERLCVLALNTAPSARLQSVEELRLGIANYLDGDRDVALRRALASEHVRIAHEALSQMVATDDPDGHHRSTALRESGHALALDAHHSDAIETITRLMAEPPLTIPAEVLEIVEKEDRARERGVARGGSLALVLFAPLVALWFATATINDWGAVLVLLIPLALGIVVTASRARLPDTHPWRPSPWWTLGAVFWVIGATSVFAGPYLITPALLVAYACAATGTTRPAVDTPIRWFAACAAAAVIPMLLHAADLLPVRFEVVGSSTILIEHQISVLYEPVLWLYLVLFSIMPLVVATTYVYLNRLRTRRLQHRLHVQMWQLRQLTGTKYSSP